MSLAGLESGCGQGWFLLGPWPVLASGGASTSPLGPLLVSKAAHHVAALTCFLRQVSLGLSTPASSSTFKDPTNCRGPNWIMQDLSLFLGQWISSLGCPLPCTRTHWQLPGSRWGHLLEPLKE